MIKTVQLPKELRGEQLVEIAEKQKSVIVQKDATSILAGHHYTIFIGTTDGPLVRITQNGKYTQLTFEKDSKFTASESAIITSLRNALVTAYVN